MEQSSLFNSLLLLDKLRRSKRRTLAQNILVAIGFNSCKKGHDLLSKFITWYTQIIAKSFDLLSYPRSHFFSKKT